MFFNNTSNAEIFDELNKQKGIVLSGKSMLTGGEDIFPMAAPGMTIDGQEYEDDSEDSYDISLPPTLNIKVTH